MSIGERLRTAREERGISLEDIARTTFIRVYHLDAIERDDYSSIPPSRLFYFVRDYARTLGVNPEDLLSELPQASTPSIPPVASVPEGSQAQPRQIEKGESDGQDSESTVISVSSTLDLDDTSKRRSPRYRPIDQGNPVLARALMTVSLILLVGLGIYYLTGGFDGSDDSSSMPVEDDSASPTRILSRPEGLDMPEGEDTFDDDSLVLQGRFVAKAWYNIKIDDRREEENTLDSGETRTWKAAEKFSISIGNAGGVELTLNGKPIGTLAPPGKLIRGKIITAEGVDGGANTASPTPTTTNQSRRRSSSRPRRNGTEQQEGEIRRPEPEKTEPREAVEVE